MQKAKNQTAEKPLITIVVPVYNTQKYIIPCLDSIQKQNYKNLEVLLIDDGSTDDSAKICRTFCKKDSRFLLVKQENQGLGPARNTGLRLANGKYICFVDSDDCLNPDYVLILYKNLVNYKADLSFCRFETFEGDASRRETVSTGKIKNKVQVLDQQGLLKALLTDDPVTTMVAWNKLVSVEWLKGFHFENKWHEDQFMINEYIRKCRKAVATSAILYEYRQHSDSIMGEENRKNLRHLDDLEAHQKRIWYFYRPKYKAIWKELFLADLENKISWYFQLYSKKNAEFLKDKIYPSYAWGFKQYLLAGGLFRKGGRGLHLLIFLFSPKLYVHLKEKSKVSQ